MMIACTACRRPVPLSVDEIAILARAGRVAAGIRVSELATEQAACVRMLVRMGYVVTTANDDGPHGRRVLITEHGRRWLDQNLV